MLATRSLTSLLTMAVALTALLIAGCTRDAVVLAQDDSQTSMWPVEMAITDEGFQDAELTMSATGRRIVRITDWTDWRVEYVDGPYTGVCTIRQPTSSRSGQAGCDAPWDYEHAEAPINPTGIDEILRPAEPALMLSIGKGPLQPNVREDLRALLDGLDLPEETLSGYTHMEILQCGAIAADCAAGQTTFELRQELIVHDPTGLPLLLVRSMDGVERYRYAVTDIAFGGDSVQASATE
ncbi:hypothetical protein BH23ACT9_BH23ACT9_34460 [soil metagenome]